MSATRGKLKLIIRANEVSEEFAMSDTHRLYRSIHQALRQVVPVDANSHAEKHLNTLTALICGLVSSRHSHLSKIARRSPSWGAKVESRIKRFKRWIMNDDVTYETYFLPFAQALLESLAHQPLVLIMDGSTVGRNCLALMVSGVYKGRALPLAWTVVRGKKGHLPQATHCALVAQVQPLVPAEATVIFVGDGEFDGTDLLAQIDGYGWYYVCRTASNTLLHVGSACIQFSDLNLQPDDARYMLDVRMTAARYGPIMAVAVWEVEHQAPLFLVSNLSDPNVAHDWYRKRFRIETFFSDQKSRGFHLQKSHLSDPKRLARLLIAACLAYLWMVYLGALAMHNGLVGYLHRTRRCDLSLFQLGLSYLDHCLDQDDAIPVAFHPPAEAPVLNAP